MEVTDLSSSRTGKPLRLLFNHDEENRDDPKASEMFPLGKVNEPDLRRLLRSDNMDELATEVEWRSPGRIG